MDLKKMVENAEEYCNIHNELKKLIEEYINKYKECELKYNTKRNLWIKKLLKEFEELYKTHGFEVREEKKEYNEIYDKNTYLKYIATYRNLEFEIFVTRKGEVYRDIRFLQTRPENDGFNIELRPNVKMYSIDFDIVEKRKVNIFRLDQIEKIKMSLEESKYSKDEIKCILSILSDEKQKLEMSIKEIDNNDFIGCAKKGKENLEFISLENLISML
ncbi:Uncharacterised protein [uncultured Clostridium sp.]|uniref:hypothetical protein n=1 Tax=uncultured Clostridium sp. TaxID=59620 RepID=UPI000820E24B|nr:hypothetical protein [uncultured Clostridium sp.]SCJ91863.1 Uncharacterised protein [uncultured Clostridium sp.]